MAGGGRFSLDPHADENYRFHPHADPFVAHRVVARRVSSDNKSSHAERAICEFTGHEVRAREDLWRTDKTKANLVLHLGHKGARLR